MSFGFGLGFPRSGAYLLDWAIASLFSGGQQGAWYDPSDLTTMFADSAGTTPVAMPGQGAAVTVGLQLDKSKGLVLGSELVVSPYSGTTSGSWVISTLSITRNGSTSGQASIPLSSAALAAKTYSVTFDVADISGDSIGIRIGGGTAYQVTTNGRKSYLTSGGTAASFAVIPWSGTAGQVTITNISVRELPGNHRFQTTLTSRPVLSARVNQLTYTEDLSNGVWTKQAGTSVSPTKIAAPDGSLTAFSVTGNGTSGIFQALAGTYSFGLSVRSVYMRVSSGTATVGIKDPAQTQGTTTCNLNTSWERFTLTETTNPISGFVGGIWIFNIPSSGIQIAWPDLRSTTESASLPSYQRVVDANTYDTAGFPLFLRADGSDDWMQTNSVDFSASDKVFVAAGVRKLSDAAVGIFAELSADWNLNAGSFVATIPNAASPNIGFGSRGAASAAVNQLATASGYAAPISAVLSSTNDIAGDLTTLRVNGTAATPATGDKGTGNFGNYAIYFFRRGGTTLPANVRDYGVVIRGGTLPTAAEIAAVERYLASKTGVVLA